MGFFSFMTQDTNKSICNKHSNMETFPVTMTDHNNNRWFEKNYDGYGVFGGKDFFELVAEMNNQKTRQQGIEIYYGLNGIKNIHTNKIFVQGFGKDKDFMNWEYDTISLIGCSANVLLQTGDWVKIKILDADAKFPNLTEDFYWKWKNEKPQDCINQGFFY